MAREVDWSAVERIAETLPPLHLSCGCVIGGPDERRCAEARALNAEIQNASDRDAAVCLMGRQWEHIVRGME